jgi:hypothetical protein
MRLGSSYWADHAQVRAFERGPAHSIAEVATRFEGARADLVRRHIETLALMGEVRVETGGRYVAAGAVV